MLQFSGTLSSKGREKLNSLSPKVLSAHFLNVIILNHFSIPKILIILVHKSIYYKSHIDQITTVLLRTGDDKKKVKPLFYTTVHLLMMDQ